MTNYNYGDIIEYIDGTFDENFNAAKHWAEEHNTTFNELMDRRDLPKRYFQIGEKYIPPEPPTPPTPPEPTEDELKIKVRSTRNKYLEETDYTQLEDAPYSESDKLLYQEYRQYLRNFTNQDDWWHKTVPTFTEWLVIYHPVI